MIQKKRKLNMDSTCHPEECSPVGSQENNEFNSVDSDGNDGSESGRSMVEMLGTLAIMGVLAIGGVAGYRYAMDKMNANMILDEVRKRAVTASAQRILGHNTIDLSEFDDKIQGIYLTTGALYGDDGFFSLLVEDVPEGVCTHILKNKPAMVSDMFVRTVDVDYDDCPAETNDILFVFSDSINAADAADPNPGVCGRGEFENEAGLCYSCKESQMFYATKAECHSCPTGQERIWNSNGRCYSCNADLPARVLLGISAEECTRCKNRQMLGSACVSSSSIEACHNKGTDYLMGMSCSECSSISVINTSKAECDRCGSMRTYDESTGYCSLTTCGSEYFRNNNGSCVLCSDLYGVAATPDECEKCGEKRVMDGNHCYPVTDAETCHKKGSDYFLTDGRNCNWCGFSASTTTTKEECDRCKNYQMIGRSCMTSFPIEQCHQKGTDYFTGEYGRCTQCNSETSIRTSKAECDRCGSMRTYDATTEYCSLATCDSESFRLIDGSCHSCSDLKGVSNATAANCESCGNRKYDASTGMCLPSTCDIGYLRHENGNCISCNELGCGTKTTADECAKCRSTRTYDEATGICFLTNCEEGSFRALEFCCLSCSISGNWSGISREECHQCSNRFWTTSVNGSCAPCGLSNSQSATIEDCARCTKTTTPRYFESGSCKLCPNDVTTLTTRPACTSCKGVWDASTSTCSQ